VIIEEKGSGLSFGVFDENECFHIEESDSYKRLLRHRNLKSVEFVLLRSETNQLYFVEAKKALYKREDTSDDFPSLEAISHKFIDSFQLCNAIWMGKHEYETKRPNRFQEFFVNNREFVFILVVKNISDRYISRSNDKLKKILKKERKIWRFKVFIMNEKMAKEDRLVLDLPN